MGGLTTPDKRGTETKNDWAVGSPVHKRTERFVILAYLWDIYTERNGMSTYRFFSNTSFRNLRDIYTGRMCIYKSECVSFQWPSMLYVFVKKKRERGGGGGESRRGREIGTEGIGWYGMAGSCSRSGATHLIHRKGHRTSRQVVRRAIRTRPSIHPVRTYMDGSLSSPTTLQLGPAPLRPTQVVLRWG